MILMKYREITKTTKSVAKLKLAQTYIQQGITVK